MALSLFYKGVPENLVRSMLNHLAKATGNTLLELDEISKAVLSCSCIPGAMKPIIQCPKCNHWQLTNHVFCPICSSKEDCDWNGCRLISCRCRYCKAGKNALLLTDEAKRDAVCTHISKSYLGPHIFYIPVEAVIADLINCGLGFESVGIEESEIVEMAEKAAALQFHNILLSKNALGIYEQMGWAKAAEAVRSHLSTMQKMDSIDVLESCLNDMEQRCRDASLHHNGSRIIIISCEDYDTETSCIVTERDIQYCDIANVIKHRLSFRAFSRIQKEKEDAERASRERASQTMIEQSTEQPPVLPTEQSPVPPTEQPRYCREKRKRKLTEVFS